MMRHFVPLAFLGTALLPDGAAALGGRTYLPCVPAPVFSCPQRIVILPPCQPPYEVYPGAVYGPAPSAAPGATPPAPPTVTQDPPARPEPAKPDAPAPTTPVPKAPMPGVPRVSGESPGGTPTEAVRIPATVPIVPVTPAAAVTPAPATVPPAAEPGRLPPLVPRVPGGEGGLPRLQIVPPPETSTSRSSPLADRDPVEVVPVAGAAPAAPGALRSVGIFNHTDRDVALTVEGETVTLPKRTYVTAAVPRKFTWKLDGGEARTTEVPPTAPGVEIVLRR